MSIMYICLLNNRMINYADQAGLREVHYKLLLGLRHE